MGVIAWGGRKNKETSDIDWRAEVAEAISLNVGHTNQQTGGGGGGCAPLW